MDISGAVLFGIIAMIGYGLGDAIAKKPIQQIGVQQTIFIRGMVITLIYIIALLVYPFEVSFHWSSFLLSILLTLLGYFTITAFYKALEIENISTVSSIAHASVIITVLLSIVVYKEKLTTITMLAVVLLCLGILLISRNKLNNSSRQTVSPFSKGVLLAGITALLWGVVWFLMRIPVEAQGAMLTSIILEGGIMVCSLCYLLSKGQVKGEEIKRWPLWTLIIVGFFSAIGTLALTLGVTYYPTSIVAALTFASPLVATIYARMVYQEKMNIVQSLAIMLILSGIILVSLF